MQGTNYKEQEDSGFTSTLFTNDPEYNMLHMSKDPLSYFHSMKH